MSIIATAVLLLLSVCSLLRSLTVGCHHDFDLIFHPSMMHTLSSLGRHIAVVKIAADAQRGQLAAHFHRLFFAVAIH